MTHTHQGACCPQHLVTSEIQEDTICMICYKIMTEPVKLKCGYGHTFGKSCIKEWIKKGLNKCPFCRNQPKGMEINHQVKKKIQQYEGTCLYCKKWSGQLNQLIAHQEGCEDYYQSIVSQLELTVKAQKKTLDFQISPHFEKNHKEIYEKYIQNWFWLYEDERNYKWWQWPVNFYPCEECDEVWQTHNQEIDRLEQRRVHLIKKIKSEFAIYEMRQFLDSLQQ